MESRDIHFMARAIMLARRGWYTTMPNPRVGCVIVDSKGVIVGEGWHERAGEPHAEVYALRMAGEKANGATAYVTLEPCSHYGRTPPCAEALISAGVSRVVAAMEDSNPVVAGRGLRMLQQAGIETLSGVLKNEARSLNEGFFKRMATGKPFVRIKLAMSLDGRTAMASGESQWITGPKARSDVQKMRAQSGAIITGVGSILQDNSSLTVRAEELGLDNADTVAQRQPLRVIIDSQLKTPVDAKVIAGTGHCLIATTEQHDPEQKQALEQAGAEVFVFPSQQGHVDLNAVLEELGNRECNDVLVETGAKLAGSFVRQNLVDELVVFMAPILMGSNARPLFELPFDTMSEKVELSISDIRAIGDDWRITAQPKSR
ncbi:bifunctional diaminohydroxyphosphoribosylaminopyrimidine deaminase/5-amino-6-(5-phosphoribosylamino)uracil reductase RibD [uncultured Endozoicomonas sp.]|uniref:bifunctional diaminohydroxyphosphoribosylaminopyrimidine deaminase/5-amino-6-(5-phosphoribosylamino)uracil reductase RibD n=1 Tax=uncultured Endozoicomonas sp. TaxID=432652 RepID=UPI002621481B|nr:bifunctional diaminohydroxyphosphoribosylaminopyrimidine deaminase/5-amino-6-(5-phosphoribosylamino)uracil reductase RibD [uncultured Endozoicomonas sp.]